MLMSGQLKAHADRLRELLGIPLEMARPAAEAQIALRRAQTVTVATINRRIYEQSGNDEGSTKSESRTGKATIESATELIAFQRYEKRAVSKFKSSLQQVEDFNDLMLPPLWHSPNRRTRRSMVARRN